MEEKTKENAEAIDPSRDPKEKKSRARRQDRSEEFTREEVQPGVIVRRRRRSADPAPEAAEAPARPAEEAAAKEQPAEKPAEAKEAKAAAKEETKTAEAEKPARAKRSTAKAKSAAAPKDEDSPKEDQAKEGSGAEKKPAAKKTAKKTKAAATPAARIITPADTQQDKPEEGVSEAAVKNDAAEDRSARESGPAAEKQNAPDGGQAEAAVAGGTEKPESTGGSEKGQASGSDETPAAEEKAEQPAPAGMPGAEASDEKPEAAGKPAASPETAETGMDASEKPGTDAQTSEKPAGTAAKSPAEAPAPHAAAKERRDDREDRRSSRKGRAVVSAAPDKDSAPSILPPIGSRQDGAAPQVRVISRPAPTAAKIISRGAPSPAGREAPGNGRPGSGQRPPRRDGNSPRPDTQRGRGFGTDKDRDSDSRSQRPAARTPRPRTETPSFGGFAPMGMDASADQSRKKRNKGSRRAGDFEPRESMDDFRKRLQDISFMDDEEEMDGGRQSRSRTAPRKAKKGQQGHAQPVTQPMKAAKKKVRVEEAIRVADLAQQMSVKSGEVIKVLFGLGVMANINNALDLDTATLVASEFGYEVEKVGFSEDDILARNAAESEEMLKPRPPVVTIMGHVDHGKTSLLDAIRKTSVTSGEAGGITQHIGAYHVKTKRGEIVFLDTPGHEAFTAMRARGAQVTDLVVLVVAADDGVMEQTREAISHSKAANVPILVAVNKIDKPAANPERVLRELSELGLQPEDWGGDTIVGYVSAKTGQGLDDLLELIALQAEVLELKANPDKPARGHVIEAKLDKGRGAVATVLIQEGTIHQGDAFVCGVYAGRVRALFNDQGKKVKEAGPSIPVEVQGFEGVPEAGEEFICLADEKAARRIAESRAIKQREKELSKQARVTLETFLASKPATEEALVLNIVLKADVQGSAEAIVESLNKLSTDKVRINIVHSAAGAISESDIMLAAASNAIIIGFNVRPTAKVKDIADKEGIDIRFYDIIYKLVEEIKSAMAGLLAPVSREVYLGQAEVRQLFSVPKVGTIAGCMVVDGKITRSAGVRLLRDGVVVHNGKVSSLRRVKDDVKEVAKGFECGVGLENFNDVKVGDIIECFETVEEAATLD
ncbi:MAG: translation initiation factor IF-2 [Mailhella sp.]|nr:translation initiation factor IF-2 [Mailhella sp.]